ncbi:MAG: hypothetical protein H0T48_06385 [Gemmatimonadaceae bacterium]|nr:hypothetical protein [Gemmatimonadaceae bacterium]
MGQTRKNERLTPESLAPRCVTQRTAQKHLDCHVAVEVVVMRFPHLAHPALADWFEESVPAKHGTASE